MDVIRRIIGPRRVGCIAVDERVFSRRIMTDRLQMMRPDEVEYIDALWYGPGRRSIMLRVYTRDFVQRMIGRDSVLVPLGNLIDGAHNGDCR